ncbi:unnamed protein product [Linum trigynum]|uniref:RING-CH-type domain-containing protein n=1 Tax=Linum trigynum TaxID=586398 RepID=A0AAV2GIE4_9ROSI
MGRMNGGTGPNSENGVALEMGKESSESGKALIGKGISRDLTDSVLFIELHSSAAVDSSQSASVSRENKNFEDELRLTVVATNQQTGGGQGYNEALDTGGQRSRGNHNADGDRVVPETAISMGSSANQESLVVKSNKAASSSAGDLKELLPKGEKKTACVIDVKCDVGNLKDSCDDGEKVCRICHLSSDGSLEVATAGPGVIVTSMELIQLGCGCKGELGVSHSHCAEAWFRLKGNRVCEICGETAKNITGLVGDSRLHGGSSERGGGGRCGSGQPFCNFLMTCFMIAVALLWFFHLNML